MINSFMFYPAFSKKSDMEDAISRAAFYFSHLDVSQFIMPVVSSMEADPNVFVVPEELSDEIVSMLREFSRIVKIVKVESDEQLEMLAAASNDIFVWDITSPAFKKLSTSKVKKLLRDTRVWRVDKSNVRMEGSFYIQAGFERSTNNNEVILASKKKFEKLCQNHAEVERAYLFCTGPSLSRYKDFNYSDGVSVLCNSTVLDDDLMRHCHADILVFADPIFHFGCSRYSEDFRKALKASAEKYPFHIIIPLKYYNLFVHLLPELKDRVIGVPFDNEGSVNIDLSDNFYIKTIDNILTLLLIPVGSTLAKDVYVIGSDGRPLKESNYFWGHNKRTQINDQMDNIKVVHPGFFNLDYNDYYLTHCKNVQRWIEHGEKAGRRYLSLVHSFVPALDERGPSKSNVIESRHCREDASYCVVSINPDLSSRFGHYLHMDLCLRRVAHSDGGDFLTLANKALSDDVKDVKIFPAFSDNSWCMTRAETGDFAATFQKELADALQHLVNVDRDIPVTLVMYLTSYKHLPIFCEVLAGLNSPNVHTVLNMFWLHSELFDSKADIREKNSAIEACLKYTAKIRKTCNITLCGDTAEQRQAFEDLYGERLESWPMFSVSPIQEAVALSTDSRRRVLTYPGNIQLAKGYDLVASLFQMLDEKPLDVPVIARAREVVVENTDESLLPYAQSIREHAKVTEGILSDEDFIGMLAQSDIILIPYRKSHFFSKTSGIFCDALSLGKLVLTTRETWAGRWTEKLGCGLTFKDGDVDDMYRAAKELVENYDKIYAFSKPAVTSWLENHTVEKFLSQIRGYRCQKEVCTAHSASLMVDDMRRGLSTIPEFSRRTPLKSRVRPIMGRIRRALLG